VGHTLVIYHIKSSKNGLQFILLLLLIKDSIHSEDVPGWEWDGDGQERV
jgi:hypothetical protein